MTLKTKSQIKKILFLLIIFCFPFISNSQNTIPTTTVSGDLSIMSSNPSTGNLQVSGTGRIDSSLVVSDTIHAQAISVSGNARVAGDLKVGGKSTFIDDITINKNILLQGGNEFSYSPASTLNPKAFFYIGNSAYKTQPFVQCPSPNNTGIDLINNGGFVSRVPLGSGTGLTNSALSISSAPWGGHGLIEVEGTDNNGLDQNALWINYFCGRNTLININNGLPNGGGIVYMGTQVAMANSARIGYDAANPIDLNSNLSIHTSSGNAIKCVTWNNGAKIFTIVNGNFGTKSPFTVYGDGRTRIGTETVTSRVGTLLHVSGEIDCKSLFVLKPTTWSDYVFSKTHKLDNLCDEEKYILKNGHLKGIPSEKEVLEKGYDLNEMDAALLAKLEAAYLYIIKLNKRIEALEEKLK